MFLSFPSIPQHLENDNDLDSIILQSNVTTAEKFRKVFEAYQLEAAFGNTIEKSNSNNNALYIPHVLECFPPKLNLV